MKKTRMRSAFNVLVVEDNPDLSRLMQKRLLREGFNVYNATNGSDAISWLTSHNDTLLLLDYLLPDMTAKEIINALERKQCSVPFIIITGHGDEKIAVEMMKRGAKDYLVKGADFTDILPHVVKRVVQDLIRERELNAAERAVAESQKQLSVLYKVSSAISQTIDMDKLFTVIFDTITDIDLLDVEKKIGLFFLEDDRLRLASHKGFPRELVDDHRSLKVGECLCGLAAKEKKVIISRNCRSDRRHTMTYPEMADHGHIIIPLNARGKVVGVLCLYLPPDIDVEENKMKLLDAIGNQIGVAIDNARLYEEAKKFALHDPLTGLANRRMMRIVFERTLSRARRTGESFSVIMLDIDHFKNYNDTHGHSEGDRLLVALAGLIVKETRKIDLVVRYGGEEFLVLLPETDMSRACEVAERMRHTVEQRSETTISLGVASYDKKMRTEKELISNADDALYKAKKRGRNMVVASDRRKKKK
jgi:diguanylate cyclase (GGDEF)-like protein